MAGLSFCCKQHTKGFAYVVSLDLRFMVTTLIFQVCKDVRQKLNIIKQSSQVSESMHSDLRTCFLIPDYHSLPLSICPVLPTPSQVQMGEYPAFYRVKTSRPGQITSFIIQILRVLEQEKGG